MKVATANGIAAQLCASRFQSYQGYYSMVGRDIERDVTPMLKHHGMGLLAFSPLAGGYLTGKYRHSKDEGRRASIQFPPVDEQLGAKLVDGMDPIAAAHGTTLEAIALAWLRHQPAVTSIITGVKSVKQLDANLMAVKVELTADELQALDAIGVPAMDYPGWMLAQGSAERATLLATGTIPENA